MAAIEGTSSTDRNKKIAAAVLGLLALFALYMAFGRSLFSSSGSATTTASASPSPSPRRSSQRELTEVQMPSSNEQNFTWQTTPVVYVPGSYGAPDAGRNIFAFYEPPPPCKPGIDCPTPTPTPFVVYTPIPTPTPHMFITFVTPQQVYAGSKTFRLEVLGDRFEPNAKLYFSQSEIPTTYISPQRLVADIPANFIAAEGPRQIIAQTPDGTKYSNQVMMTVQAPPRPQFQYVGMIAKRLANNDTAIFREQGKPIEFSARLDDIVGGRFRLVSISSNDVVLQDTSLGFRHRLELFKPTPGTVTSSLPPMQPVRPDPTGARNGFPQGFPQPDGSQSIPSSIPGIPDNIPRATPQRNQQDQKPQQDQKKDDSDSDGDG